VRNTGKRDAPAIITGTLYPGAVFTGTLHSSLGSGDVYSDPVRWAGTVAAGGQVTLTYAIQATDEPGGYSVLHEVGIDDGYGEVWYVRAYLDVPDRRRFLPLVFR